MTPVIDHGTIWLANLNPGKGTEPGKRDLFSSSRIKLFWMRTSLYDHHPADDKSYRRREPLRVRVKAREKLAKILIFSSIRFAQ